MLVWNDQIERIGQNRNVKYLEAVSLLLAMIKCQSMDFMNDVFMMLVLVMKVAIVNVCALVYRIMLLNVPDMMFTLNGVVQKDAVSFPRN